MKHTKMKKRLLTLTTMVMALVVCMLTGLSVFAADTNVAPAKNLTTAFEKYLVMDEKANVPKVDFTFTIAPGSAATGESRVIYAGNDDTRVNGFPVLKVDGTGSAASAAVNFRPADTTYTTVQDGDTVTLGAKQKYAKKTVTVDFSNVKFNAPGIYRYIITEAQTNQDGITDDNKQTRTLDVFVEYEDAVSGGQLIVSNYILYPGTRTDAADVPKETKDNGFTNTYATKDLTLEKQVTGNQGDRNKYFAFTVNIADAVEDTVYTVDLTSAEAGPTVDGKEKTNEAVLTAVGGTVTATYYLKDDQSIIIRGLTGNTRYTITENPYVDDGYKTSYIIDSDTSVEANTTGSKIMGNADHRVVFTNHRSGLVPTGILLETAPYIILGVAVLAGFLALFVTRRRRRN